MTPVRLCRNNGPRGGQLLVSVPITPSPASTRVLTEPSVLTRVSPTLEYRRLAPAGFAWVTVIYFETVGMVISLKNQATRPRRE